jgi:hypothetical protein
MKQLLDKRLFFATTSSAIVAVLLGCIVIPGVERDTSPHATPGIAVPALWVFVILQLLIAAGLVWTMFAAQRSGAMNRRWLLTAGLTLILTSLMLTDGALSYLDHPDLQRTAAAMFVSVGFDFVAGMIALFVRYEGRKVMQ